MPDKKPKMGPISIEDRKFILANMNTMSVDEMGKILNRHPALVKKVIKTQESLLPEAESNSVRIHLKRSLHWKHLKEEFIETELNKIEDQYIKFVQQFREDVTATEEVQILNLIKLEILMDRNLKGKMKISGTIARYESMIESLLGPVDGNFAALSENDRNIIMDLENKKQAALSVESSRTNELVILYKEHNVLMERVMGSRDQRITEVLNTKVSFMGMVKELLERDKQEKDSRLIELSKKSVEKEFKRLAAPHSYEDNVVDNPILCSDTIELFEEENETETEI